MSLERSEDLHSAKNDNGSDEFHKASGRTASSADEPQIVTYSNFAAITNSCASAYHSILSTFGLQQIWQSST
jgi:hypothetical protein